jgi:RimJ/RimL family protein N-acetyltransferase
MVAHLRLPIVGQRLTIRTPLQGDLEAWYQLEVDPDVKRYVGGPVTRPRNEWIAGMRKQLQSWTGQLAVEVRSSRAFAGRARLDTLHWELQVLIGRTFWGKGFGREVAELLIRDAFDYMHAPAIFAVVHPDNTASRNLIAALGFESAGIKTSDAWDDRHLIFTLQRQAYARKRRSE